MWDGTPERVLDAALKPPHSVYIEPSSLAGAAADEPRHDRDGLFLSLTTVTAYRQNIASLLVAKLAERISLDEYQRECMETALYEAITNAVLHGNLGIAEHPGTGLDGLEELGQLVQHRLAQQALALKRVRITAHWSKAKIEISIRDEGEGYGAQPDEIRAPPQCGFSGRGLMIVRAMADRTEVREGGRCLCLAFSR
jgi:anti-sigma regulatory factor (Ser/Thr protein kinase)